MVEFKLLPINIMKFFDVIPDTGFLCLEMKQGLLQIAPPALPPTSN
jgi:hypothetical protein